MPAVILPNSFVAHTLAVASEVNANFAAVLAVLNGDVDEDNLAATVTQRQFEPGDLKISARSAPSTGWLLCDGSAVSRSTYADLFTAIGTTYGVGDGSTTFNVPDLRGRTIVTPDGAAARLSANDTLGDSGGEEKHTLTEAELASHDHGPGSLSVAAHAHGPGNLNLSSGTYIRDPAINSGPGTYSLGGSANAIQSLVWSNDTGDVVSGNTANASPSVTGGNTANAGSGNAHNTMQPFLVLSAFIKT